MDHDLQVRVKVEADVFTTSSGRLLMALLPPKELEKLIKGVGYNFYDTWR